MPRDTDKRLLGLWGLELSVEGRQESDRVTHFPVKYIQCACKRDLEWLWKHSFKGMKEN